MFCEDSIINIEELLNREYIFFAHTSEDKNIEKETLQEHLNRCIKHFKKIVDNKQLDLTIKKFEKIWFFSEEKRYMDLFEKLIVNTITFHDLGKINPQYQRERMKNNIFLKEKRDIILGSDHSIISAILYLEYFLPKSKDFPKAIRKQFRLITYINAYVISKHHGNLGEFKKFLDSFDPDTYGDNIYKANIVREKYKKYFGDDVTFLDGNYCERWTKIVKNCKPKDKESSIYLYTYEKLLYSLLIASDYYATTEYRNKFIIKSHGTIEDINIIKDIYNKTKVNQSINNYKKEVYNNRKHLSEDVGFYKEIKDINVLRNELYLDAEAKLLDNVDENIFYLEAPTGSGKSNVAFNLSFSLIEHNKELNKIMYIYPFNTLVEQNVKTIENTFGHSRDVMSYISVVNSVTPILKEGDNYKSEEYEKALLDRQFFNYPISLSTHVTLFNLMFGKHKESGFAFYQLANSVIVLDEIQSYKNTIWTEIISFLKGFAKVLNIKVIIMSATLPNLDILSEEQTVAVKLVTDRDKYFMHPIFKDRVRLDYQLLESTNIIDELNTRIYKLLVEKKKVLVEFIKKKSAIEFYNNFVEKKELSKGCFRIELMTGDDSSYERNRILSELDNTKEGTPFLLISTQVIEAGVDLKNMEVGFKDISKLDSEEQFMGRINRSSKNEGIVYFFNYDNAKTIYKNDVRINDELTLKSESMRSILNEKKFNDYYVKVLEMIKEQNDSTLLEKNIDEFFHKVGMLNVPLVNDRMKLIEDYDWTCTVFIGRKLVFDDGEELDGSKVWDEYKDLLTNKKDYEYAEWRIRMSTVKSKMSIFIYQINQNSSFPYTEQLGEIFFIENGEHYFKEGKFIREKLENQIGLFL